MGLFTNKKVLTVETATKEVTKVQENIGVLQQEQTKLNTQKSQLAKAKEVIQASLVIDENDKPAQKQLEKATSKLADIEKQLQEIASKLQKAQEERSEAQKDLNKAQGEAFKKEQIETLTRVGVVKQLEEKVKQIREDNDNYKNFTLVEWGQQYGFNTVDGRNLATQEQAQFAKQELNSARQQANEKAKEIVNKVLAQLEKELKAQGIELN
ncbi:hypothetical protein [Bacillus sp. FJAT-45037]|uniref:hypothetical protein n=1 Tax=Bacillus sp. FJAT-45037 TaxID=2011007 RepID=UPI000C25179C|nr:hypothetical protein [Bacillus sp. FJAT-45037]